MLQAKGAAQALFKRRSHHERIFTPEKQAACGAGGGSDLPLYSGYPKQLKCPPEKEKAIREALKHLMI